MSLRYEQQSQSTLRLLDWLKQQPQFTQVLHPSLSGVQSGHGLHPCKRFRKDWKMHSRRVHHGLPGPFPSQAPWLPARVHLWYRLPKKRTKVFRQPLRIRWWQQASSPLHVQPGRERRMYMRSGQWLPCWRVVQRSGSLQWLGGVCRRWLLIFCDNSCLNEFYRSILLFFIQFSQLIINLGKRSNPFFPLR